MNVEDFNAFLLKEFSQVYPENTNLKNKTLDIDGHVFNFNSDGHRGENFKVNVDLLYAGCSLTHGSGLPQDAIWGDILSKKINADASNLAYRGGSIIHIVNNIFNYIKMYGEPKMILCCFPALDRIRWFDDNTVTICKNDKAFSDYQHLVWPDNIKDKYIKLPVEASNIIHGNSAKYFSIFAIKMLENYCNAKNIYFKWLSWAPDPFLDKLMFNNKIDFLTSDLQIKYEDKKWIFVDKFDKEIDCHNEYKDEIFYTASDIAKGYPHMGKHVHLHIAEVFERNIKYDNSWN